MNPLSPSCESSLRNSRAAMTFPEVMIALGIGSILLAVVAMLSLYSSRTFAAMGNYVNLDSSSRNALDRMIQEIRQTTALTAYTSDSLTFTDSDGAPLQFVYDATERKLNRIKAGTSTVMLSECDFLQFNMFQRNPLPGARFSSTTTPANCKLVDMTWKCSRQILGKKLNTENVQTAKIVIRNKR